MEAALDVVYTIGGRAFSQDGFAQTLETAGVDLVLDVRWRLAARGAAFSFLNRRRLEALLATVQIGYLPVRGLAPPPMLRAAQHEADAAGGRTKYSRSTLSPSFVRRYQEEVLDSFDFARLLCEITPLSRRPALLCLEPPPVACHRSFAAERLAALAACEVYHLGFPSP